MNLFGVGLPEMAVILVVGLLIFGPRKLPEIGRTVAKTIKSLQSASKEFEAELRRETSNLDKPAPKAVAAIEAKTKASAAEAGTTDVKAPAASTEADTEAETVGAADTDAAISTEEVTTETEVVAESDTWATDNNPAAAEVTEAQDVSIPEPQKVA